MNDDPPTMRPLTSPSPGDRSQAGFTIIEVIATALIVALLGLGTATALVTQTQTAGGQHLRSEANALVNQDQERLRGLSDQALSGLASQGSSARVLNWNGTTYANSSASTGTNFTVTSSAAYQDSSGNSSCASSSIDYFKVSSQVTWTNTFSKQTQTASADTLLARPVTGELQTSAVDQTGASLPGVSIVATPTGTTAGSGQSGSTDSSGCSLFAGLASGTYLVSATKSGFVSQSDQTTASTNVTVTNNGASASDQVILGAAGSLAATFQASASGTTYPGQADALSYQGGSPNAPLNTQVTTSIAAHGTTLLAGQTGIMTPTTLFPWNSGTQSSPSYTGNYSDYAGQCAFQNPNASGNVAGVSPAGSASATVQEPFLYISSIQGQGQSITPRDLVLTYSGGGCTDQYAASVATATGGTTYQGVTFGQTTPSTGWLADPGQPYAPSGDLTVCADVYYNGSFDYGTATVANTSMTARNAVPAITINQSGACPGVTS